MKRPLMPSDIVERIARDLFGILCCWILPFILTSYAMGVRF